MAAQQPSGRVVDSIEAEGRIHTLYWEGSLLSNSHEFWIVVRDKAASVADPLLKIFGANAEKSQALAALARCTKLSTESLLKMGRARRDPHFVEILATGPD